MEQLGQNMLINLIIRPQRAVYPSDEKDNNKQYEISGKKYVKKVFTLQNEAGNKLSCLMYEPIAEQRPAEKMPVVIYMHGNAGCKLEGEYYRDLLLPAGINLFSFDFSGCGLSEGEWVTLGHKEKKDLAAVIDYLNSLGTVSKIGVWGRSMGAATSIIYMSEIHDKISAAVLDSGFSSFQEIVNYIAELQFQIPQQFVEMLMVGVSQQIEQLTGMKPNELKPVQYAPKCKTPALFLHGIEDDFVEMSHTEKNYEAYGGEKDVIYCEGSHNTERPQETLEQVLAFLKKHLIS